MASLLGFDWVLNRKEEEEKHRKVGILQTGWTQLKFIIEQKLLSFRVFQPVVHSLSEAIRTPYSSLTVPIFGWLEKMR